MKRVSVFGSTGFIGRKAVEILRGSPADFTVCVLVARDNVRLLIEQAKLLNAQTAVIADETCYQELRDSLSGTGTKVSAGLDGIMEAAGTESVDCALMAITGIAALGPTMKLIDAGVSTVALASKESLVCGASFLMKAAADKGTSIVPIDSEHNAIFRLLSHGSHPDRVTITASGGPFLHWTRDQMQNATLDDALAHPVWRMGDKISVDSATMANKALEIIEASYLFSLDYNNIDVVVHPESVIHALVSYVDGTSIALLSSPNMSIPILHALYWPEDRGGCGGSLDLVSRGKLTFLAPDTERFPLLNLGFGVLKTENSHAAGIIFNAANEVAVEAFLSGEISFTEITSVVMEVTNGISCKEVRSLSDILEQDLLGRQAAKKAIRSLKLC